MIEVWKPINGFPFYEVSNFGRVRSRDRNVTVGGRWFRPVKKLMKGRILRAGSQTNGYLTVVLCDGVSRTGQRSQLVHRLVAIAHVPNPEGHKEINHINGIKTDNSASNLEWCSRRHNLIHAIETGLRKTSRKQKEIQSV